MEKDLIFSLALFPATDGALLRHPLNRTPKAARQELCKEPAVHINVNYSLTSMRHRVCRGPHLLFFVLKIGGDVMFVALSAAGVLNKQVTTLNPEAGLKVDFGA